MADDLPHKDSPDLRLVVATPEEILAQAHVNSEEWKGALTLGQYLKREEILMQQDLTKDGGLTPWMLVHQPASSEKPRRVLCGCESIKKKALLAKDGKVEDVVAHGVASVFCPNEYRGRGYAGRMMAELGKRLEGWQAEKSAFSVLFSDIGKSFYAARGWQPFRSPHISLPPTAEPHENGRWPHAEPLEEKDLDELCAKDEQLVRRRLQQRSSSRPAVALLPDATTLRWHYAKEEFVASTLNNGSRPEFMEHGRGAITNIKGQSGKVWIWWMRVWTNPQEEAPDTLHILRLGIDDEAYDEFETASWEGVKRLDASSPVLEVAALLERAQVAAQAAGMKQVQIWNPNSVTLSAARMLDENVRLVDREKENIASLRWYGEGSWENVDWVCNEKYGWC